MSESVSSQGESPQDPQSETVSEPYDGSEPPKRSPVTVAVVALVLIAILALVIALVVAAVRSA
jgi:hypothetical protein